MAIAIPVAGSSEDEGEPIPDFHGWRKPVRNILLVVLALIVVVGVHSYAESRLEVAWMEYEDCVAEAHGGSVIEDPEACRPGRLWLSSRWPSTREGAKYLREHSDYEVDVLVFSYGSRVNFDRPRRAEALKRLLDNQRFLDSEPLLLLDHNGAHAEILDFVRAADTLGPNELEVARDAALMLADVEAQRELGAKSGEGHELSFVSEVARTCLLEPETRAEASAGLLEREVIGGDDAQRLTLIACRGLEADAAELEQLELEAIEGSWAEAWLLSREASEGRAKPSEWLLESWYSRARAGPLAQANVHEQPKAAQLLLWLAPSRTWEIEHVRLAGQFERQCDLD